MRWAASAPLSLAIALAASTLLLANQERLDLSEKALVTRASRYVEEYEKQFAFLIADEEYRQTQFGADGQTIQTRTMRSELFLTYLPADAEWIAVRDVMEVDGRAVPDRQDLRALLSRAGELRGLVGKVVEVNARYNIGRVERNFNEPTLPLLLLATKRVARVNFDRKTVVRDNDTTLVTLEFEENERPTLISFRNQGPAKSRGEFVLDAATGTVRRTLFRISADGLDVRLETAYAKDAKLDLWLPSVFTERYETGRRNRDKLAPHEVIECEAKYSNYRRFDVNLKIKKLSSPDPLQ